MSAANIHNTQRSLEELKKYFRPLAKFIRISSRESMCLRAMSGGVRGARWTQIDAIARGYALETRRMAIALSDELQESVRPGTNRALRAVCGSSVSVRRASSKTSRERMCPGVLSGGVRGARWTQIDAIARVNVPWRALEGRLLCQMNSRKVWDQALTGL